MHLIDELKTYVSASPQSLEILQRLQAEKDAAFEKFKAENPSLDAGDQDWQAQLN